MCKYQDINGNKEVEVGIDGIFGDMMIAKKMVRQKIITNSRKVTEAVNVISIISGTNHFSTLNVESTPNNKEVNDHVSKEDCLNGLSNKGHAKPKEENHVEMNDPVQDAASSATKLESMRRMLEFDGSQLVHDLKVKYQLSIISLVETRVSRSRAISIIHILRFDSCFMVNVEILQNHAQCVYALCLPKDGSSSFFASIVYGHPTPAIRQVL
ncbi:hypothetical protein VNO78_14442 [Psophocarpus tetragonolobus]|uniref:Uncharacterized protein n=1 Tax=Psophocarpus tetragonolobus TaxID=3891 RepID=A0AAN9ST45_PSOTE